MAGWVENGMVTVTTNAEGLALETYIFGPFRTRRYFIPWRELHDARIKEQLFGRKVVMEVGHPTITTLQVASEIIEQSEGRTILATTPVPGVR